MWNVRHARKHAFPVICMLSWILKVIVYKRTRVHEQKLHNFYKHKRTISTTDQQSIISATNLVQFKMFYFVKDLKNHFCKINCSNLNYNLLKAWSSFKPGQKLLIFNWLSIIFFCLFITQILYFSLGETMVLSCHLTFLYMLTNIKLCS